MKTPFSPKLKSPALYPGNHMHNKSRESQELKKSVVKVVIILTVIAPQKIIRHPY